MHQVMQQVGFKGTLKEFFAFLTTDKQFEFKSEQALLDAYNGLRKRIDAKIPEQFSLLPTAGFEIRPIEAFRAAASAGGEYQRSEERRVGQAWVSTRSSRWSPYP